MSKLQWGLFQDSTALLSIDICKNVYSDDNPKPFSPVSRRIPGPGGGGRGQFGGPMYFYRGYGCGRGEALAQSNKRTTIKIKTTGDKRNNNDDASQASLGVRK